MATPAALPSHPGPEHLVTVKVLFNDSNRRFKLPLKDLRAQVLPEKVRRTQSPPELRPDLQSAGDPQSLITDNQITLGDDRLSPRFYC